MPSVVPFLLLCAFLAFLPSCTPSPRTTPQPVNVVTIPTQLNFFTKPGANPAPKDLGIGVANRVSVAWSVQVGQPWLTIAPANGETPRNFTAALPLSNTSVSVDASKLPPGGYSANISIIVGGQTVRSVPVRVHVADIAPGEVLSVPVEPGTGTAWAAGIRIDGTVEVSAGILDNSLFRIGPDQVAAYNSGDMAVFVKGTLSNDSDQEWQIDFWPQAYDAAGNELAWGLDQGGAPLPGHLQMNVPAHGSRPFTLHLTWAEHISKITINSNKYPAWPPLP